MKIKERYTRTFIGRMERYDDKGEWIKAKHADAVEDFYNNATEIDTDYIEQLEESLRSERKERRRMKNTITNLKGISWAFFCANLAVVIYKLIP